MNPYAYLSIWSEYENAYANLIMEWEMLGAITDATYFAFIEAEKRWMESTGR